MGITKITLKKFIRLFVCFIFYFTLGLSSSCVSNRIQVVENDLIEPEIGFISNNKAFDFLYADGIYNNDINVHKFEQNDYQTIDWDNFSLDFDFFTSVRRKQWPIMMGSSTRTIGFLLNENMTISITANNQKQNFQTQGLYQKNRWYHVKIIKLNNHTEVYLDNIKIGDFQIQIDETAKNYFPNTISSVNYSNGIAFDGWLKNIIYTKKADFEFSKKIYEKYTIKYNSENLIFSKVGNLFVDSNEYKLFNLNWKSFRFQFDYLHIDNDSKLIIGDKWRIFEFNTLNDIPSVSVNNNRINYLSGVKLETNHKYKIDFFVNNGAFQLFIDGNIVLNAQFDYYNEKVLERENEVLVVSKNYKPSKIFKSLTVQNDVSINKEEFIGYCQKNNDTSIDTINEGAVEALFVSPFELNIDENYAVDDFAFTKSISEFNVNAFEITFDFLTNKYEEQHLLALGVYTKFSEIDLSIANSHLVFKINNGKSIINPVEHQQINRNWNNCKLVYDNGILKIYLNGTLNFETKIKFSEQFYKTKLLTIKNSFVGKFRNLYVYDSVKI